MSVAIIGGGLAGISAALALRDAGIEVTIFEARAELGGATYSFRRNGLWVDNGQHVFLRCCTAYRTLLQRLATTTGTGTGTNGTDAVAGARLQDRLDVTVLAADPQGSDVERGRLRRAALPRPLQLLPALAGYRLLSPADRVRAVRAALALSFIDPHDRSLDAFTAGRWLAEHGQRKPAAEVLWELFITASLNARLDQASMASAAMVLKTALLGRADAADIGMPTVPLSELHGRAALAAIEAAGGRVRLKAKVQAIEPGPKVVVDGMPEPADAVVVAVPHHRAVTLVPKAACPERESWAGLGHSPIINVHVVYDRAITDLPFTAAVGSPVQWVFDRTQVSGLGTGQYVAVSVSAADRWIAMPANDIRSAFLPELRRLFPAAQGARVRDFFVTRNRRATFRPRPGTASLRPAAATGLPGVFLAGAWTDTGWPDTMEGAVRSGLAAARSVQRRLRHPTAEVRPV